MKITPLSHHPHRHNVCQHHQDPRHRHLDCHQVVWYVLVQIPSSRMTLASLPSFSILNPPNPANSEAVGTRTIPKKAVPDLALFLRHTGHQKRGHRTYRDRNGNFDTTLSEGAAFFASERLSEKHCSQETLFQAPFYASPLREEISSRGGLNWNGNI